MRIEKPPFETFADAVYKRLEDMARRGILFEVDAMDLYEKYLSLFPEGTNPIYKVRHEYECTICQQFIKNLGKVVIIYDNKIETIWNLKGLPYPFDVVAKGLDDLVKQLPIVAPYFSEQGSYGRKRNINKEGTIWTHFHWSFHHNRAKAGKDADSKRAKIVDNKDILSRTFEVVKTEAFEAIVDMIKDNNLYRGQEFLSLIDRFWSLKKKYDKAPNKEFFVWNLAATEENVPLIKFKNTVIGELIFNLSVDGDLEKHVGIYEVSVSSANYRRSKSTISRDGRTGL